MIRIRLVPLYCALLIGCTGQPGTVDSIELSPCAEPFTHSQILDSLQIVSDYLTSIEKIPQYGLITYNTVGASQKFMAGILKGLIEAKPEGVEWNGVDSYIYGQNDDESPILKIKFVNNSKSSLGAAGTPITYDFFNRDNYLVNANSKPLESGGTEVNFLRPGPLAALLGYGDEPENPIINQQGSTLESETFKAGIEDILVHMTVRFTDTIEDTIIHYGITSPTATEWAQILNGNVPFDMQETTVSRNTSNQKLVSQAGDLKFIHKDEIDTLDGKFEIEVNEGIFDYRGILTFEKTIAGTEQLICN